MRAATPAYVGEAACTPQEDGSQIGGKVWWCGRESGRVLCVLYCPSFSMSTPVPRVSGSVGPAFGTRSGGAAGRLEADIDVAHDGTQQQGTNT